MKIKNNDMIRIARREAVQKIMATLKPGEKVSARILDRQGRYFATLQIGKHQLKAEFPAGLPGSNHLTLQLLRQDGDAFLFRLAQATETASLSEKIAALFSLPAETAGEVTPSLLARALQDAPGIFELLAMLAGSRHKNKTRGEGITQILHRLMGLGLPAPSLALYSRFLAENVMGPEILHHLLMMLRGPGKDTGTYMPPSVEDLLDLLNNEGEKSDNRKENIKIELALKSLEIIAGKKEGDITEIPLVINDEYLPLKVFHDRGTWIISLELSSLGPITIMAREEGPLTVTTRSREISDEIIRELQKRDFNFSERSINFITEGEVRDKLVAINSFYSLNSQLDIKV